MSQYRRKRFNVGRFFRFVVLLVVIGIVSVGIYELWNTTDFPVVVLPYQGGPASSEDEVADMSMAESGETLTEPDVMTSAAAQMLQETDIQEISGKTADDSVAAVDPGAVDVQASGTALESENYVAESSPASTATEPVPLVLTHTVSKGETLWDIAKQYNVTMDTIIVANQLTNVHRLRIGQVLQVPTKDGVLYTVRSGDSLWTISQKFQVDTSTIIKENNLANPSRLQAGQTLFIPGMAAVEASRYQLVGPDGKLRAAFLRPVSGGWISSRFGMRWGRLHAGVDIAVPVGTPVRAAADGVVKFSGTSGGYGLLVTIDHGDNVETRYGHNSRLVVKKGQKVKAGQIIAYSGNTGNSTGPHVHFEIRLNGKPYDPLQYIR